MNMNKEKSSTKRYLDQVFFHFIFMMSTLVCSQADEPISDYAAMDDVYQGERLFSPVFISILFRPVMIIVFSHMESCFSFAVGMPEEGFKGEHA